jgi:hypothetical protein
MSEAAGLRGGKKQPDPQNASAEWRAVLDRIAGKLISMATAGHTQMNVAQSDAIVFEVFEMFVRMQWYCDR